MVKNTSAWVTRGFFFFLFFSHSRVIQKCPELLTSSFLWKSSKTRRISAVATRIRNRADEHTKPTHVIKNRRATHTRTRFVSIFRASAGIRGLNLEGHFVKQIQHQRVGRLSKHTGHVFPSSVCVYVCGFIFSWTLHVQARARAILTFLSFFFLI